MRRKELIKITKWISLVRNILGIMAGVYMGIAVFGYATATSADAPMWLWRFVAALVTNAIIGFFAAGLKEALWEDQSSWD